MTEKLMSYHDLMAHCASDFKEVMGGRYRPKHAVYIQAQRLKAKMTQTDLAQALGTYQMKVVRMESGEHRLSQEEREGLARVFKVPMENFYAEV